MFRPRFSITHKLLTYISQIEVGKEIVGSAQLTPEWERRFRQDAIIRRVYFGTLAESSGSSLTEGQTEKIITDDPGRDEAAENIAKRVGVVARERDIQAVVNYRNAIKFTDQLSRLAKKTQFLFGEKELMQTHSLVMERILPSHQLGVYRVTGSLNEGSPLPVEVPYQMEDFWRWFDSITEMETHPLFAAGIAFQETMRIQPFTSGNCLAAAILAYLCLSRFGYEFKGFLCLEEALGKNRTGYQEAFASVMATNGDFTKFLEFFCSSMATEIMNLKDRVRRLAADSFVSVAAKQVALSERQLALMDGLRMKEEMSIAEARSILPMVSDDTILRDLMVLVAKKLVKKKGKTKGAKYLLR